MGGYIDPLANRVGGLEGANRANRVGGSAAGAAKGSVGRWVEGAPGGLGLRPLDRARGSRRTHGRVSWDTVVHVGVIYSGVGVI